MADAKETTIIAADTFIKGEMTFQNTARIQGKFEGKIEAKGQLQVSEGAQCSAEVDADTVILDGRIEGNVRATQKVQINAKASLKGDIVSERLVTAEGASLHGHVSIGPDAVKGGGGTRPAPSPSPSPSSAAPQQPPVKK